jgi:hypothetical protein
VPADQAAADAAPRGARSAWAEDVETGRTQAARATAGDETATDIGAPRAGSTPRMTADEELVRVARGRIVLTAAPDATGPAMQEASGTQADEPLGVGVTLAATAVSAGLVGWTLYGATALWVLLATGRLARTFDPLPVLAREGRRVDGEDGESDRDADDAPRPAAPQPRHCGAVAEPA